MRSISYNYNLELSSLRKIIFNRNKATNSDLFRMTNNNLKIFKGSENLVKKVVGVEIIPLDQYNNQIDKLATNNYFTNSNGKIDINSIKKKYQAYDNNLVILTLN